MQIDSLAFSTSSLEPAVGVLSFKRVQLRPLLECAQSCSLGSTSKLSFGGSAGCYRSVDEAGPQSWALDSCITFASLLLAAAVERGYLRYCPDPWD